MTKELRTIESMLTILLTLQSEVLTVDALSILTGWSKGNIYKKTSANLLPYYKPNGKTIYFKKSEIEQFLLSNRQTPSSEIEDKARRYVNNKLAV